MLPYPGPRVRRQLTGEPGACRLVHLEQRLALHGIGALLVALFHFGQCHPEALREKLDRVGEPDFFVQLEELEHVAADPAAEAVEETLIAIDLKRRRLLTVKRT